MRTRQQFEGGVCMLSSNSQSQSLHVVKQQSESELPAPVLTGIKMVIK